MEFMPGLLIKPVITSASMSSVRLFFTGSDFFIYLFTGIPPPRGQELVQCSRRLPLLDHDMIMIKTLPK